MIALVKGQTVRIVEDCRRVGGSVTGQLATYEGMFPYCGDGEDNPRFRLADGSEIWGCQCWWERFRDDLPPLAESQEQAEKNKATLRAMIDKVAELLRQRGSCTETIQDDLYADAVRFGYEGVLEDADLGDGSMSPEDELRKAALNRGRP